MSQLTEVDKARQLKLAQRFEKTLQTSINTGEPRLIDPRKILVAPCNRQGAPPNVMQLHLIILASFFLKGFDRTRPHIGICAQLKSPAGKQRLIRAT